MRVLPVGEDALLVEVNPLVRTVEGQILALDSKVTLDDNARFRQARWGEPDSAHDDPLEAVLVSGLKGRHVAGPGQYETLVAVGHLDGLPMFTFTAPHGHAEVPHAAPSDAYLAMIGAGLREAHDWSDAEVATYLAKVAPRDGAVRRR